MEQLFLGRLPQSQFKLAESWAADIENMAAGIA
jgi:hypothetical protein